MKKIASILLLGIASIAHAQEDLKTTILDLSQQSSNIGMCIAHQHYLQTSQADFPESKDFNRENIGVMETCNVEVGMLKLDKNKLLLEGVVSKEQEASINQFLDNSRKIGYCDRINHIESVFKTADNVKNMPYFNSAVEKGVLSYLEITAQSQIQEKCTEVFAQQRKLFATIREM